MKTTALLVFALVLLISSCKKDILNNDEIIDVPSPKFLLPESDAYWITYGSLSSWPEGTIRTINKYSIGQDTTVNGTDYSTLKKNTIFIYDYDSNQPNDTILCEGIGGVYRQDKTERKIYYPHIQNSTFQEERLFMDFSLGIGDTLFYSNSTLVVIYDTSFISLSGESLKLLSWVRTTNYSWPADSGFTLQAYEMPFNLPYETCDCNMPGGIAAPIFIFRGDTLRYDDIAK